MVKNALIEIQSMFPRQKTVNAIEVFLAQNNFSKKNICFGSFNKTGSILLKTPLGQDYCVDRYFEGSELSKKVFDNYNLSYGVISLICQLCDNSKSSIGKEIVRAFTKNVINVTRSYFEEKIPGKVISCGTIVFPTKDEFFSRIFDPAQIRKEM